MSDWINVTDKLPETKADGDAPWGKSETVLIWLSGYGVRFANYYLTNSGRKNWGINNMSGFDFTDVTHWMPLPEPPTP